MFPFSLGAGSFESNLLLGGHLRPPAMSARCRRNSWSCQKKCTKTIALKYPGGVNLPPAPCLFSTTRRVFFTNLQQLLARSAACLRTGHYRSASEPMLMPQAPLWSQQPPVTVFSPHFALAHKGRIKVQPFPASSWQRFQPMSLRAGMMINWAHPLYPYSRIATVSWLRVCF